MCRHSLILLVQTAASALLTGRLIVSARAYYYNPGPNMRHRCQWSIGIVANEACKSDSK